MIKQNYFELANAPIKYDNNERLLWNLTILRFAFIKNTFIKVLIETPDLTLDDFALIYYMYYAETVCTAEDLLYRNSKHKLPGVTLKDVKFVIKELKEIKNYIFFIGKKTFKEFFNNAIPSEILKNANISFENSLNDMCYDYLEKIKK